MDRELAGPSIVVRVRRLLGLPAAAPAGRLATGVLALASVGLALALASHFAPRFWNQQEAVRPALKAAPAAEPAAPIPPPSVALTPKPLPLPLPERPPAASAEVAALVSLHGLGADLGEPVEVVSGGNGVATVVCRQIGPEREAEIRAALAGVPGVTVRSEPAPAEAASHRPRATLAPGSGANAAEPALVAALGGRSAFDRLANEILETDDAVLSRAHAIHAIEERFPPPRQAALEAADRTALERIAADHRHAARESAQQLERLLGPASSALGVPGTPDNSAAGTGLLAAAQRMDRRFTFSVPRLLADFRLDARMRGEEVTAHVIGVIENQAPTRHIVLRCRARRRGNGRYPSGHRETGHA